ncbi:MAG: rhodanese-like domain-containing protein [Hyphomicrobium aestuarii]|nr:rhodanese-like domain-containing protein [Hyphomicrobium aestuarii]
MRSFILTLCAVIALAAGHAALAAEPDKSKQTKLGKYLTASEAHSIVTSDPTKTLFVDVRTRAEVQFIGMTALVDGQIPYVEMNEFGEWDDKNGRFKLDANPAFTVAVDKLLTAKGLTKTDRIIVMCRSGERSARAVNTLADAGFPNVWSQVDGFEGDLSKDGRRDVNGWKNAGLPWSYKLDKSKVYLPSR